MAKKKNRNAASRRAEHPNKTGAVTGVYPISTGEAELVPDGYHSDGWLLLINGVQSSHVIVGQPRMLDFEYMRWIVAVLDSHIQTHLNPEKLRITHLGGGASDGACITHPNFYARRLRNIKPVTHMFGQLGIKLHNGIA